MQSRRVLEIEFFPAPVIDQAVSIAQGILNNGHPVSFSGKFSIVQKIIAEDGAQTVTSRFTPCCSK